MRKPIKPFYVETRRAGRKPVGPKIPGEDEAPKSVQPEWPPVPDIDDSYGAAMRAADALFSRPAPDPEPEMASGEPPAPPVSAEPPRRILESLNEDDHIARLLAEEEEHRPRRGRRPREAGEPAPVRMSPAGSGVDMPAPVAPPQQAPEINGASGRATRHVIPGYVRGQIYARYARHDQARPGEQWRKRAAKPLW